MFDKNQISIYFRKFIRLLMSKKTLLMLLEAIFLPFIISLVYNGEDVFKRYQVTRTASLIFISAAMWIGLFNSITSICNERKVIKFEYQIKGLSLPSYLTARVMTEFCLCLIETFLMLGTMVCIFPNLQENLIQIILSGLTLFFVMFSADMLALLISALVRKSAQAMTLMPLVLMIQLLFSNFIETVSEGVPFSIYLSNATLTKWGTTALFRIANMKNLVPTQGHIDWQIYQKDGLGTYVFDMIAILGDWAILVLYSSLFIIATSVVLKSVRKDNR